MLGRDRWLSVALAVYLAVVAWGTLGPAPPPADRGAEARAPRFVGLSGEEAGNVAMFVPFGLLVPLRFGRWRWWTVPAGVALSGLIELTQLVVVTHRSPEWRDVGWNSVGAAIGFSVWLAAGWAWPIRRRVPGTEAARS